MAKPFDITLKHLIEAYPRDWLRLVGIPSTVDVEIVDADLATVSAETDKLFLIKGEKPWLANLELQASYKTDVPDRLFFGGTLASRRHKLQDITDYERLERIAESLIDIGGWDELFNG